MSTRKVTPDHDDWFDEESNPDDEPISITADYKKKYQEYVDDEDGEEEEDEFRQHDVDDENRHGDSGTPEGLEKSLIITIRQFATFVASITSDLEETEEKDHTRLKEQGKKVPTPVWRDSTFKIEFTKGLILKTFKPSRLMKYYIVFLLPMKKWITNRNEKFFLKAKIFPGAPEADIKFFRALWSDDVLSRDEKDTIWDYWDTQIEIVEDWQELTDWEVNSQEGLNIPDIDYDAAAREAGLDSATE